MSFGALDALTCPTHGWLAHTGFHESGHAVAAILLGFEFVDVSIRPGHETFATLISGSDAMAGGVRMPSSRPSDWALSRPDDSLVYVLAGTTSERRRLDHFLDDGYREDVNQWRRGTGRQAADNSAELKARILEALVRAQALLDEHWNAVESVYGLFIEKLPRVGNTHFDFEEPLTLSYDEVLNAVTGATS